MKKNYDNRNLNGKWMRYGKDPHIYKCSLCGIVWKFPGGTPLNNSANYCPRCGAKMDEVEE